MIAHVVIISVWTALCLHVLVWYRAFDRLFCFRFLFACVLLLSLLLFVSHETACNVFLWFVFLFFLSTGNRGVLGGQHRGGVRGVAVRCPNYVFPTGLGIVLCYFFGLCHCIIIYYWIMLLDYCIILLGYIIGLSSHYVNRSF